MRSQSAKEEFKLGRRCKMVDKIKSHNLPKRNLNIEKYGINRFVYQSHNLPKRNLN